MMIIDTSSSMWMAYIEKLPEEMQDIYFSREYYKMCEKNNEGIGKLFVYEKNEMIAIYPFLINKIKGEFGAKSYYDIQTAYGYGGPLTNTKDEEFIENFEKEFIKYCKEQNIVAEFIRFHPLLKNEILFREKMDIIENRKIRFIDLEKSIENIWEMDIISKNRNMIRKAEKSGLEVKEDIKIEEFKKVYNETMKKVKAEKEYYFNDEYFEEMKNLSYFSIGIKKDKKLIAAAIFLKGKDIVHYHLAGSIESYLKYAPNNLLLWTAIKYAKQNGFKRFHFGGGTSNSLENPLYKFKKSFCKEEETFFIGKRIHKEEIYYKLIDDWEFKNSRKAIKLLQYREE